MMRTRLDQIEEAAIRFHRENPRVWELFVRFTFEVIERGFSRYSAYAVFERIRWETDEADYDGRSTFKLNNNYRPYYARWFMARYPEHQGFFKLRVLTSAFRPATSLPELGPEDYEEVDA